jgi:hypothetical protein
MIEMDEQFQREFGLALQDLRHTHQGLIGTANNSRGEARQLAAGGRKAQAISAYEAAHAYMTAANRVRPVISLFEDADRRAASLMEQARSDEPKPISAEDALTNVANAALQERVRYLEDQLARLDTALRGRPATLDEKIRETETTEDLIDAAIRVMSQDGERARADREKDRADRLGEVTSAAAKLLGVTTLPEILTALERLVTGEPFDFGTLVLGSLIAGEWVSAAGSSRKTYVGRFCRLDADGPVIEYVCECSSGTENGHVVSTKLSLDTVRLPTADEIIAFGQVARKTGLLRLPDASDE